MARESAGAQPLAAPVARGRGAGYTHARLSSQVRKRGAVANLERPKVFANGVWIGGGGGPAVGMELSTRTARLPPDRLCRRSCCHVGAAKLPLRRCDQNLVRPMLEGTA